MTSLDPMWQRADQLTTALTTARSWARSADGLLQVEACADGEIVIRIDDRALAFGGAAVSAELTRLAAKALADARATVQNLLDEFRKDPRIARATWATQDAMNQPPPKPAAPPQVPPHPVAQVPVYEQDDEEEARQHAARIRAMLRGGR